jgi:hypothetical protein
MTEEIKQLTNVSYKLTDEVITRNWLSVNARKTRLLSLSDWTQMADVNLPQNIKNVWRQWRSKVRAVKRSAYLDPNAAMEALKSLEQQIPEGISDEALAEVVNMPALPNPELDAVKQELMDAVRSHVDNEVNPRFVSMEDVEKLVDVKLEKVQQMLIENFQTSLNKALEVVVVKSSVPEVPLRDEIRQLIDTKLARLPFDEELFQEAVDFLSDHETSSFPLLMVHAEFDGKKLSEKAKEIINQRRSWLQHVCKFEKVRLQFVQRLHKCNTLEELEALRQEISAL